MELMFENSAPKNDFEWGLFVLHDILLQESSAGNLLNRIYQNATPRGQAYAERIDPLMHLLGFDPKTVPDVSVHQYGSAMGTFFERLVKSVFQFQRNSIYSDDWKAIAEKHNLSLEIAQGKRWADMMIGKTAIELKYRYSSGESSDWQGRAAQRLKDIGMHPVMLVLRPSRNCERMSNQGWEVHEGQAAVAYIEQHTNINIEDLAKACRINPIVADHTNVGIQRYKEGWSASAHAMVLTMEEEQRMEHLKELFGSLSPEERMQILNQAAA